MRFLGIFGVNNFLSPSVTVRELRSGLPQIRGVPTNIGGFIGQCNRGPVTPPVRISSFAQFVRIFGSYNPNSYLAESVKAFFDNGGSACYIIRVLGSSVGTNAKASVTLNDAGAIGVMTFTSVGEGSDNNGFSVLASLNNSALGTGLLVLVSAGTVGSVSLSTGITSRLTVGDTISLVDGINSIRAVVAKIQNNTVTFQNNTTAAGNLTTATTVVTLETFNLSVLYNGTIVQGPHSNMRMSSLSAKNYFVNRIGGVLTGSLGANAVNVEYVVTVADLAVTTANVDIRPVNVNTTGAGDSLIGGTEAATFADGDYIGQNGTIPFTGIYATTPLLDLRLVAIPGTTGQSIQGVVSKTLFQFCESNRARSVAIITAPLGTTPANAITYKAAWIGTNSYYGFYYPWVQILHPLTGLPAFSPPEGYVMGMIARTDRAQGVAKAPAGEYTGQLVDPTDVERILSEDDKDTLYPVNINPIENLTGVGICVMGSRTGDFPGGDFNQMHVRRTFIYLEQSLKIGTRFVLFEPNTAATRQKVKRATDNFLVREWKQGTLDGDNQAQAFTTICDGTNNPLVVVQAQQMVEDIFVNIPQTVENLVINIQQNTLTAAPGTV